MIYNFYKNIYPLINSSYEAEIKINALAKKVKEDGKNSDFDCIIGLSGGLDSSIITYKYNDISSNFSCYTADFKNKDQSDSIYAAKIAKTLNLNHI